MANDAYALPGDPRWMELDKYGLAIPIGYDNGDYGGLRGHVFSSTDNSTIIVSFKGTSVDAPGRKHRSYPETWTEPLLLVEQDRNLRVASLFPPLDTYCFDSSTHSPQPKLDSQARSDQRQSLLLLLLWSSRADQPKRLSLLQGREAESGEESLRSVSSCSTCLFAVRWLVNKSWISNWIWFVSYFAYRSCVEASLWAEDSYYPQALVRETHFSAQELLP